MSNKIPKRADCDLRKDTPKGASLKNKGFISCVKDALHVNKSMFYIFICPAISFVFLLLGLALFLFLSIFDLFPSQGLLNAIVFAVALLVVLLLILTPIAIEFRYFKKIGLIGKDAKFFKDFLFDNKSIIDIILEL
mgnify:CR=1 FL=1